jgi:hypothetical protein
MKNAKQLPGGRREQATFPRWTLGLALVTAGLLGAVSPAHAVGDGDNPWQFQSIQDRVNKGAILDLILRRKAGYYDAIKSTTNINNTTNTFVDKQFNCSLSSSTTGNAGVNSTSANTSSPSVSNSSSTNANTSANTASNGLNQSGLGGVGGLLASASGGSAGGVDNTQANSGNLGSNVTGSTTSGATGAINASGGQTQQALNSNQSNTGSSMLASITNSTACSGPLNGN